MNQQQEGKVAGTRIVWTEEEWNTVAVALMKNPHYLHRVPDIIKYEDMVEAIQVLPEHRRRPVFRNGNKTFNPGLEAAYVRIRGLLTDTPAPPPPAEQAPAAPKASDEKERRVFWRPEEYDALARELYRMMPHARYEQSSTLAGLSIKELLEAERNVLPPERRRHLKQLSKARPQLVEAFARIRNQLAFAEAQKFLAKPDPAPAAEPTPEPMPEPVAQVEVPAPEPVAPPAAETGNIHELALKALVELIVPSLAKALAPVLAGDLMRQFGTLAPSAAVVAQVAPAAQPAAPVAPTPAAPPVAEEEEHDPLEFQPPAHYQPPAPDELPTVLRAPEKPRLPMVGVLGLKPIQFQELRAAFPNIDLVSEQGHHSTKTLKSLQSAARVIAASTSHQDINLMTDKMLRNHFGDRYLRVNGGMSMVKRQIQMWIHAGVLK